MEKRTSVDAANCKFAPIELYVLYIHALDGRSSGTLAHRSNVRELCSLSLGFVFVMYMLGGTSVAVACAAVALCCGLGIGGGLPVAEAKDIVKLVGDALVHLPCVQHVCSTGAR